MMSEWSDVVSNNPEELLQTVERSAQVEFTQHLIALGLAPLATHVWGISLMH